MFWKLAKNLIFVAVILVFIDECMTYKINISVLKYKFKIDSNKYKEIIELFCCLNHNYVKEKNINS